MDVAGKNEIIYQVVDGSKDVNSLSRMVELCNLDSIDFSKWSQGSSFGSSGYESTSYLNAISADIFSVAVGHSNKLSIIYLAKLSETQKEEFL